MWVDSGGALKRIDSSTELKKGYPSEADRFQLRKQPDAVVIDAECTRGQTPGPVGKGRQAIPASSKMAIQRLA